MQAISALVLGLGGLFFDIAPEPVPRDAISLSPVVATPVAMEGEVVTIDVHPDHADVRARFTMRNTSRSETSLEVGFPGAARPGSWTMDDKGVTINSWHGTTLQAFRATVDGKPVEATCKQPPGTERAWETAGQYDRWYLWPMTFAGGQRREVVVSYRVPTKDVNYTPEGILKSRKFAYVLKTGAGWHGPIGSARVLVRSTALDPLSVTRAAPAPTRRTPKELEWSYRCFEPETDIVVEYTVHADAARALKTFERRLQEKPDDTMALVDAALAREALRKTVEAADTWRALAEASGEHDTTASVPYGRGYVPAEHHAARLYRKAGRTADKRAIAASGADRLERFLKRTGSQGNTWWVLNKLYRTSEEALKALLADLRRWTRE
jgi:hypothetical protein